MQFDCSDEGSVISYNRRGCIVTCTPLTEPLSSQPAGRGGTASDSDLSASQLRGRYGVQNHSHQSEGGSMMMSMLVPQLPPSAVGISLSRRTAHEIH